MGKYCPKNVELILEINKLLLLHLIDFSILIYLYSINRFFFAMKIQYGVIQSPGLWRRSYCYIFPDVWKAFVSKDVVADSSLTVESFMMK